MNFIRISLVVLVASLCHADPEEEFEVGIELVGCFADDMADRALPVLFANFRSSIDWSNVNETVKQCADAADKNGYRWFGVQYYGECWSGPSAEVTYNKHGMSTNCASGIGKDFANAVYRFFMRPK